ADVDGERRPRRVAPLGEGQAGQRVPASLRVGRVEQEREQRPVASCRLARRGPRRGDLGVLAGAHDHHLPAGAGRRAQRDQRARAAAREARGVRLGPRRPDAGAGRGARRDGDRRPRERGGGRGGGGGGGGGGPKGPPGGPAGGGGAPRPPPPGGGGGGRGGGG